MEKFLFACDLDGTVLVPARHAVPGDVPAETIGVETRSFWPAGLAAALRGLPGNISFVPVTSRSVEQYRRLDWPEGTVPVLAVVANGAILLDRDGRMPLADTGPFMGLIAESVERLAGYPGKARVVDGAYAYLHLDAEADLDRVRADAPWPLREFRAGRKLYCVPPGVDKETAVSKLCRMLGAKPGYAAGDGPMDAGMLRMAGRALVPAGGVPGLAAAGAVMECPAGMRFQDFVASCLAGLGEHPA